MQKVLFFLLLLLFFNNISFSQDLTKVDKIMYSYNGITSIKELSERIDYDFKTDIEKVRAIYTWIALNIEYDYFPSKLLKSPELFVFNNDGDLKRIKQRKIRQAAQKTFKTKKGVCIGFAYLFHNICNLINIKSELIYGYTRTSADRIGIIPEEKNHVWNAVKINNEWLLMDVTFGSGYLYKNVWQRQLNLEYFNVKKSKLKTTHFPSDIKWHTFLNQKPLKEFCYAPLYKKGFQKNKLEVLAPKSGKIVTSNNNRIHIKLKKTDKIKDVKYLFSSNYKIHSAQIINKEAFSSIYLKPPKKNTTLHIYVNNELSLEYKVKVN